VKEVIKGFPESPDKWVIEDYQDFQEKRVPKVVLV
jgi:hypothetical protein